MWGQIIIKKNKEKREKFSKAQEWGNDPNSQKDSGGKNTRME